VRLRSEAKEEVFVSHRRISIFDTTLRDGEQSPGIALQPHDKAEIAEQLERLGVDVVEAGFPGASTGDFEGVRAVAAAVREPTVAALARTRREDIDAAREAVADARRSRIHVFIATSVVHMEKKLGLEPQEVAAQVGWAVDYAKSGADEVEFSCEDATRSDPGFVAAVCGIAIRAGATTINLPDTVGYALPEQYAWFLGEVRRLCPELRAATLSVHCHNDLGLAVANSLAGVAAGADQVECTVNGIGERAGNASLEEIVMATRVRSDRLPFQTDVDTRLIYTASQLLTSITGEAVQANKAIVGRNAFAHEAGIHQDGMLKDRRTYEIMRPEEVGVPRATLVLGKHSGRHAVQKRCEELGCALSRFEIDRVYRRLMALADAQKQITDGDLRRIVQEARAEALAAQSGVEALAAHGYGHGV
jgi:2-isopropylmalate synthase